MPRSTSRKPNRPPLRTLVSSFTVAVSALGVLSPRVVDAATVLLVDDRVRDPTTLAARRNSPVPGLNQRKRRSGLRRARLAHPVPATTLGHVQRRVGSREQFLGGH